MSEMTVTIFAANFSTWNTYFIIGLFCHEVRIDRSIKARPPCSRIIFITRAKEWLSSNNVDINPCLMIVPVGIVKWWFSPLLLCDTTRFLSHKSANISIRFTVFFGKFCILTGYGVFLFFSPILMNEISTARTIFVEAIMKG